MLSGEFQVVNNHLLRDLTELNLWNEDIKNAMISANGSIQGIEVVRLNFDVVLYCDLSLPSLCTRPKENPIRSVKPAVWAES